MTKPDEHHVISLICQLMPGNIQNISSELRKIPGLEIHGEDPTGKMIITLEGPHQSFLADRTNEVQNTAGVLSVAMVYHEYISELIECVEVS